jgi:hypothetical protein
MADIRTIITGDERHDGSACAARRLVMAAARVRRIDMKAARARLKQNDLRQDSPAEMKPAAKVLFRSRRR